MLETARRELRETIMVGAAAQDIEAAVQHAAPGLDEEQRSSLWLYAWHWSGGEDGIPGSHRSGPRFDGTTE